MIRNFRISVRRWINNHVRGQRTRSCVCVLWLHFWGRDVDDSENERKRHRKNSLLSYNVYFMFVSILRTRVISKTNWENVNFSLAIRVIDL